MATRVVIHGRTWYANRDFWAQAPRQPVSARVRQPAQKDVTAAIPSNSPESPFKAGVPFYDPDSGITYRRVRKLDPREGWATMWFWTHRWDVSWRVIYKLVEMGLLDAAMEDGSQVKRYRCRDEQRIVTSELVKKAVARNWSKKLASKRWRDRKKAGSL